MMIYIFKIPCILSLILAQNAQSEQKNYQPQPSSQTSISPSVSPPSPSRRGTLRLGSTRTPSNTTAPEAVVKTFIGKTCQKAVALSSDVSALQDLGDDDQQKCVVPQTGSAIQQFDSTDFLGKANKKLLEVSTRLQANLQDVSDLDKDIISVISTNPRATNTSLTKDFYPNINPDVIKFMFSLCVRSYNDNTYGLNQNNQSSGYQKLMNEQNATIKNLEGKLVKIENFKKFMVKTFGQETIGRLEKKRLESQKVSDQLRNDTSITEGKYGQDLGIKNTNTPEQQGFDHHQGGDLRSSGQTQGIGKENSNTTKTEVQDLEIRSFAPELVKAIAQQYNVTFNGDAFPLTEHITLSDIEERLNRLSLQTENALVDARNSQRIFADKRVGEFWAKLDSVFDRQADGFMPIDVLYRNLVEYKDPMRGIASGFINSKKNSKTDLGGKEFSGIILYRPGLAAAPKRVDQMILAFSGSNSSEDWKYNLDVLSKEGRASVNLAAGLRVHGGILSSLEASIEETGTKMKSWFKNYTEANPVTSENKPTLRIFLTGHSLGGALAQLMAVYVKQNIEPYIKDHANLEIIVYTFGAPPIFYGDGAAEVESMLGKTNIIRVWDIGDPVATMSILKKTEEIFNRSPLMVLFGYHHIGLSIPLYDTTGIAEFFDKLNPWKNHLSDRYNNLIQTNWKELLNRQANQAYGLLLKRGLLEDEKLKSSLEQAIQFVRYPSDNAVLALNNISPAQLASVISEQPPKEPVKKVIGNYDSVLQQQYQQQVKQAPQLAKAETKDLAYTHRLPTGQEVHMNILRSTSCEIANIATQSKTNLRTLSNDDRYELSCGCCLSKNFFVSNDASTTSKLRGLLGRKKISTLQEVYGHCSKYCKPLEGKKFPSDKLIDLKSITSFMGELGLKDKWLEKKLK